MGARPEGSTIMRVLIVGNYYYPEEVGAGIWIRQLAVDLKDKGHTVTVLTSFPSYPDGVIPPAYKGRVYLTETIDDIQIVRTWTYATQSKSFWPRFFSFGAFCASALVQGGWEVLRKRLSADVVYAVIPPLPLGVAARCLAMLTGAALIVNVQDIYPDIAVDTGFLKSPAAIQIFRRMERWVYRKANLIVVISEGFRNNLLKKSVPAEKISVVPNWADLDSIRPASRETRFRTERKSGDRFVVLYSGGFSHNSCMEPVIQAAAMLPSDRFQFLLIGSGVKRAELVERARTLDLRHVEFLPFQPFERYAEVLASSDVTLVTLNTASSLASVPSKIFKQMAAGRPIIAVTQEGNELSRLIGASGCGVVVAPDDPAGLAQSIQGMAQDRARCTDFGAAGRAYIEAECSRTRCVSAIEELCRDLTSRITKTTR